MLWQNFLRAKEAKYEVLPAEGYWLLSKYETDTTVRVCL